MPRNKLQDLTFTLLMVLLMVYTMTFFNTALETGLTYQTFGLAFAHMWTEVAAAFVAQRYIARPLVHRLMNHLFPDGEGSPRVHLIAMAGCTVMLMAPMMTLFVTFLHHGITADAPLLWLPKLLVNFPFALFMQVFYIGPLVRVLFRALFGRSLRKTA